MLSGSTLWPTAVGVAAGTGMLWLVYTAVRTVWPVYYASFGPDDYGIVVNRGAFRYFAFAVMPVYGVALVVGTTVGRLGGHAMACALAIAAIHIARTQMRHIFVTVRNSRSRLRVPSISYAAVMAVLLVLATFLAGLGPGPVPQVVPEPKEFFNAFWTTAFVAPVTAFVALKLGSRRNPAEAVRVSEQEVGPELIEYARDAAIAANTDPNLVIAVLLTENLQRPPWFRRLERIRGRFISRGSYGVMQVISDKPISDRQSIDLAISAHLSGVSLRHENGSVDRGSIWNALYRYNNDQAFLYLAMDVFDVLHRHWPTDGRPYNSLTKISSQRLGGQPG